MEVVARLLLLQIRMNAWRLAMMWHENLLQLSASMCALRLEATMDVAKQQWA